jgi:hypothetical protein
VQLACACGYVHVPNLVPRKLHHVYIVGVHALARWGQGPPSPVCAPEKTPYAQTCWRFSSVASDLRS